MQNPLAQAYVRPLLCSDEYLDGRERWCLWLQDTKPEERKHSPGVVDRLRKTREYRLASTKEATRKLASTPHLFAEIRQPSDKFLLIPQHTSNEREYIPLSFFDPNCILHNSCSAVLNADLFSFGLLSSSMHIAWLKGIGGKIKSDPRYSITLVYNNFPWPQSSLPVHRRAVEQSGQAVLDARVLFTTSTLDDLYDPLVMPVELVKAHRKLDRAVERCYRPEPFTSDRERVELLFTLYEQLTAQLTAPLLPTPKPRRRRRAV